tara:strand:- start:282 stop:659 length:378 start_codon:yes stop_codon:yes gene_type:complete
MKLSELKIIVKDAVKEAIQESMKDILLEAVRAPKQTVYENKMGTPTTDVATPSPMSTDNRMAMRENIQGVLGGMMPDANGNISANTSALRGPLQVGAGDTAGPNGSLPSGEVDMSQIMGLMNGKG